MRGFSDTAADQAAEWLTALMSSDFSDADQLRWRQWRAADPEHELAWQHIEAVCARLKGLHGGAAYQALSLRSPARRKSIALLLGIGVAGTAGMMGARSQEWRQLTADLHTGVGERREWTLDDGSRVMLNTDSAVNVRLDSHQRLLTLVAGEIRIITGHATAGRETLAAAHGDERPFIVETMHGRVRALGTTFTVRQTSARSDVTVQQSAVCITPSGGAGAPLALTLREGQRTTFSARDIAAPTPAPADTAAWTQGAIVADDMRLADFLAELGRHRRGVLRCDPAVADLKVSGVFALKDSNAILAMLPNSLPVRIRSFSPYWITVEKR